MFKSYDGESIRTHIIRKKMSWAGNIFTWWSNRRHSWRSISIGVLQALTV